MTAGENIPNFDTFPMLHRARVLERCGVTYLRESSTIALPLKEVREPSDKWGTNADAVTDEQEQCAADIFQSGWILALYLDLYIPFSDSQILL